MQRLRSLPAHEAEGLGGLLNLKVLEDSTKNPRILRPTKNRRQPTKKEGTKRIHRKSPSQILHKELYKIQQGKLENVLCFSSMGVTGEWLTVFDTESMSSSNLTHHIFFLGIFTKTARGMNIKYKNSKNYRPVQSYKKKRNTILLLFN